MKTYIPQKINMKKKLNTVRIIKNSLKGLNLFAKYKRRLLSTYNEKIINAHP